MSGGGGGGTMRQGGALFGRSQNEQGWQAAIHSVVSRLGRTFGFQAFNKDSRSSEMKPLYTPATIFLVSDHLFHLLVKNYMRRDETTDTSDDEKFVRAVARLHAAIFQAYKDWCAHVQLPPRLPALEYKEMCRQRGEIAEWEFLLEELALYFLVYSEGANLRHTPELIWFIFWMMRNSWRRYPPATGFPRDDSSSAVVIAQLEEYYGIARKEVHLRNKYHHLIRELRAHPDINISDDGVFAFGSDLEHNKMKVHNELIQRRDDGVLKISDVEIDHLMIIAAYGDSGEFLNRVVDPIFSYFAEEVYRKKEKGVDIQYRVAYDDCDESVCSKEQVHKILKDLGVKFNIMGKIQKFTSDPYLQLLVVGMVRIWVLVFTFRCVCISAQYD